MLQLIFKRKLKEGFEANKRQKKEQKTEDFKQHVAKVIAISGEKTLSEIETVVDDQNEKETWSLKTHFRA